MSPVAKVVAVVAAHVLPVAEKIASALPVAENLVLATSCDLWAGCMLPAGREATQLVTAQGTTTKILFSSWVGNSLTVGQNLRYHNLLFFFTSASFRHAVSFIHTIGICVDYKSDSRGIYAAIYFMWQPFNALQWVLSMQIRVQSLSRASAIVKRHTCSTSSGVTSKQIFSFQRKCFPIYQSSYVTCRVMILGRRETSYMSLCYGTSYKYVQ